MAPIHGCIEAGLFWRITISSAPPSPRHAIVFVHGACRKASGANGGREHILQCTRPSPPCIHSHVIPARHRKKRAAKAPKSWDAPGHGLHLPPHELQETSQANSPILCRDRGSDKAMDLSLQTKEKVPATVAGRAHRGVPAYSSGQISRSSSASLAPPLTICWRCMFSSFVL